jgi:succinyl-diaminopimelate desuccinylase
MIKNIFANFDSDEAVQFLQKLIRLDTVNPPGNEEKATACIEELARLEGVNVTVDRLAPNRANLMLHSTNKSDSNQTLVFSGHTDTVPVGANKWEHDPWSATIVGDKLYGRGTTDMKSGLAAMIMAFLLLHRSSLSLRGNLLVAASAGEEVDCRGAEAFIEQKRFLAEDGSVPAFVVGEPTNGNVIIAHKGAMWIKLKTYGRTAHGSTPQNGINAIEKMMVILNSLDLMELSAISDPLLGNPTYSLNQVKGGIATNVVPDQCEATIDIRTIPQDSHCKILASLESIISRNALEAEIEILTERFPVFTDADHPLVHAATDAVREATGHTAAPQGVTYYSDASVYQPALGSPVVLYGPGIIEMAHQPDEYVSISSYLKSIEIYVRIALHYLGVEE